MTAPAALVLALAAQPAADPRAPPAPPPPAPPVRPALDARAQVAELTPRDGPIWSVPLLHTAALMGGMRLALTLRWPGPYAPLPLEDRWEAAKDAYRRPPEFQRDRPLFESDGDPWPINVIGHGLFGSEVYARSRRCGAGALGALGLTVAASTAWEYAVEGFHQRPSALDLVATPVLGLALGELRFQVQRWLHHQPRSRWRRALEIVVDPLGEAERVALWTRC